MKISRALGVIFVLAAGAALSGAAEREVSSPPDARFTGSWAIREWSTEETGGMAQSFDLIQDPTSGFVYAANEGGVLEYDGVRWRRLPVPRDFTAGQLPVWSVMQDGQGRIWAGSNSEILRYAPDIRGVWQAERVQLNWPEAERGFGVVWQLRNFGGHIWAVTATRILRIDADGRDVKSWEVPAATSLVGVVDGELWFRRSGNELIRIKDEAIAPAPAPALPEGLFVRSVLRTTDGRIQLEHSRGILELSDGVWRPWSPELATALGENDRVVQPVRLANGTRIFSTRSRALVFVDAAGHVLGRFNEPAGVTFGVTPKSMLDRDGGLWMVNASGIRRIEINSPVARHARAEGLRGGVRDLGWEGATLWAATSQGLFARDASTGLLLFSRAA